MTMLLRRRTMLYLLRYGVYEGYIRSHTVYPIMTFVSYVTESTF